MAITEQQEFDAMVDRAVEAYKAPRLHVNDTGIDRRIDMEAALEAAGVRDLIEWQRAVIKTINGTVTPEVIEASKPFEFDIGALFNSLRARIEELEEEYGSR